MVILAYSVLVCDTYYRFHLRMYNNACNICSVTYVMHLEKYLELVKSAVILHDNATVH